jgi:hypothetical protein
MRKRFQYILYVRSLFSTVANLTYQTHVLPLTKYTFREITVEGGRTTKYLNSGNKDASCVVALILVIISEMLSFNEYFQFFSSNGRTMNFEGWTSLDPDYLKEQFSRGDSLTGMVNFASLAKALSLFAFFVPILQVSWILSNGGKRHLTAHVAICVLAASGGLCELVVNLMMIGIRNVTSFLVNRFNLDDWSDSGEGGGDGTGWRVLEIVHLMTRGKSTV